MGGVLRTMLLALHSASIGRHEPGQSLAAEGVVLNSCNWFTHAPSRRLLHNYYVARQSPTDCNSARFLLLDGFNDQSGLGFSFLSLHAIFLQALHENRTLVASPSVYQHGYGWRWCAGGYRCYFENWSPCEESLAVQLSSDKTAWPTWDIASYGQSTVHHRVVHIDLRQDNKQEIIHLLYRTWLRCVPAVGRSWWWAATWDVLLRFQPWVHHEALKFLQAHRVRVTRGSHSHAHSARHQLAQIAY